MIFGPWWKLVYIYGHDDSFANITDGRNIGQIQTFRKSSRRSLTSSSSH